MIDNLTFAVTDRCNSKCTMCNQWEKPSTDELSPKAAEELMAKPEFSGIEYLNLTGGEPFLREDLGELADAIMKNKKRLKAFFISTNGTMPRRAAAFAGMLNNQYPSVDINVTVSIDGDKKTNRLVRGIDSYPAALRTIEMCKTVSERIHTMISTTLTPINCSYDNLAYLNELAEKMESSFSFRIAAINADYYRNPTANLNFDPQQIVNVIRFSRIFGKGNPFLQAQADFLETGILPIMGTPENLLCKAGNTFAFINAKGDVYPCINSSRKIGDYKQGILVDRIDDLGAQEQCVCCTECTFFPMFYDKKQ